MMERTGQVKAVTSRDFQSTILWSFQLEGSNRFFRTGKDQPDISEGEWIKFNDKNGVVMTETITRVTDADAQTGAEAVPETAPATNAHGSKSSTPRAGGAVATPSSTGSATASQDVGKRMKYQAARRDASNIVIAALHCDHLPHASNIAKGKRLDLLLAYVSEVTDTLLEQEDAA